MFKAVDLATNAEIIILRGYDAEGLESLRQQADNGEIVCPTCRQRVRVRAGEVYRPHFAHRVLSDCPTSNEPPELLEARAVLFKWLATKFGDGLTVEYQLPHATLPRPIDCFASLGNGDSAAYWIIPHGMRSRDALRQSIYLDERIHWHFVFLRQNLRHAPDGVRLLLSTTERDFCTPSEFAVCYWDQQSGAADSLHYLDAADATLTTARAMKCVEWPQVFRAVEVTTPLDQVKVRPSNGEFVHPGEAEKLEETRRRIEEERRQREEQRRADDERMRQMIREAQAIARRERKASAAAPTGTSPEPSPQADVELAADSVWDRQEREGTCLICGQRTRDWYYFEPPDRCKCNACMRAKRGS